MPDRPAFEVARPSAVGRIEGRVWLLGSVACAGLLGAAGVGVGAVAAHLRGNDLARTASEFLLIHAAAVSGASGVGLALGRASAILAAALTCLVAGSVLFGGDLALAGIWDWRPLPIAAPTGGLLLIAGWLLLTAAAVSSLWGPS